MTAPIEYVHVDFIEKPERGQLWVSNDKPVWYKENISPIATIPTLLDNSEPFMALKGTYENDVISEHLFQKFGSKNHSQIIPSDTMKRAAMRQNIAKVATIGLIPSFYQLLSNQNPETDTQIAAKVWKKMVETNKLFCEFDLDGPYLFGDEISLADTSLIPFLDRFSTNLKFYRNFILLPDNCEEISKLKNMLESSRKRESMKETSQTPEFYINAYRSYAAKRRRSTEQEMKDMENFQQSMLLSSESKL